MTEAIFDHTLKMRLVAHVDDKQVNAPSTRDDRTPQDSNIPEDESTTTAVDSSSAEVANDSGAPTGKNMLGNLNNLITTDIGMLDNANELLLAGTRVLEVVYIS